MGSYQTPARRSTLLYFVKNILSWTLLTATVAQTVNAAVAVPAAVTVTVAGAQHIPTAIVLAHAHVARNLPATVRAQAVTVARKFPTSPATVKEQVATVARSMLPATVKAQAVTVARKPATARAQVATVASDLLTVIAWVHAHVAGNM